MQHTQRHKNLNMYSGGVSLAKNRSNRTFPHLLICDHNIADAKNYVWIDDIYIFFVKLETINKLRNKTAQKDDGDAHPFRKSPFHYVGNTDWLEYQHAI